MPENPQSRKSGNITCDMIYLDTLHRETQE